MNNKPLNRKSYGSIPHLPGSRLGVGDKVIAPGQVKICTEKLRDRHDFLIVQEKLDGSCMAVAKKDGEILALSRAGYLASASPYQQHKIFSKWVTENEGRFHNLLNEGERVVGEWLVMAHGIKYKLDHEPFVAFDILTGHERINHNMFMSRVKDPNVFLHTPHLHHLSNKPFSMDEVFEAVKNSYHGGEFSEGVVFRIERKDKVDFLAKWVNGNHECGKYFTDELNGEEPIWNDYLGRPN